MLCKKFCVLYKFVNKMIFPANIRLICGNLLLKSPKERSEIKCMTEYVELYFVLLISFAELCINGSAQKRRRQASDTL